MTEYYGITDKGNYDNNRSVLSNNWDTSFIMVWNGGILVTKKTKRCYKVCMVEFGKKQKCLKTCGIKNRSKCKFSRDGLHDIRNLNEFVCE